MSDKGLDQRLREALQHVKDNPDCETSDDLDGDLVRMMFDDGLVKGDGVVCFGDDDKPYYDTLYITLAGERELERLSQSRWRKALIQLAAAAGLILVGVIGGALSNVSDFYVDNLLEKSQEECSPKDNQKEQERPSKLLN